MGTASARLEVVAGKAAGTVIVVDDELVIGRHAEGPGQLAGDDEISRAHARVTVDSGVCAIEDLGSTNGTFVNGLRISAPKSLSEGDAIELGGTTLMVRAVPATHADEETPAGTDVATELDDLPPSAAEEPTPVGSQVVSPPVPPEPDSKAQPESPALDSDVGEVTAALSLRLEVDFAAREAQIFLTDTSDPVRLVFERGAWRPAPAPASEKGSTP